MKKAVLLILVLFAVTMFVGCTDLSENDEYFNQTHQVDPATVKPPTGG